MKKTKRYQEGADRTIKDIRALALQRWPNMADRFSRKKDHSRAEAALIGAWYIQKYLGPQTKEQENA